LNPTEAGAGANRDQYFRPFAGYMKKLQIVVGGNRTFDEDYVEIGIQGVVAGTHGKVFDFHQIDQFF
jgi:hypothetical protein